jgi:alkanesulfonate monooxygenase SsuD/methylene tetrahydromethanopterin reductase-like flavin-dependent oxidoreductase (luciferase family)
VLTHNDERPPCQFGVMLYPDERIDVLVDRIQWLEELGFDQVFLPDHSANLRNRHTPWFDSWAVLAAGALNTTRIRLGVLVANQILRPPAQLAKQAVTLDHLSGARFELGIGAGIFDWDHFSVGEQPWSPKERALASPTTSPSSMTSCTRVTGRSPTPVNVCGSRT